MSEPGSGGRRAARKERLQELARAQFLDAAEEVFGTKGVHAATIKEIAERAEYSVGSVYLFFENKDDLFVEVLARRGREMVAGIEATVRGPGTPMQRLAALARFEATFFRDRRAFARLYLSSSAIGGLLPPTAKGRAVEDGLRRSMELTASVIRSGQADGTVCDGDPVVLARLLSGIVSAYQATDPEIVGEPGAHLTLEQLGEFVARAFAA